MTSPQTSSRPKQSEPHSSSRPERSGAEGPCLHDKPLIVATSSSRPEPLGFARGRLHGVEGPSLHDKLLIVATSSSRPERSGVEGPCLHDKPLIVERRSLGCAACAASLGTTEVSVAGIGIPPALLRLADRAERRKDNVIARVLAKLASSAPTIDITTTAEAKP